MDEKLMVIYWLYVEYNVLEYTLNEGEIFNPYWNNRIKRKPLHLLMIRGEWTFWFPSSGECD